MGVLFAEGGRRERSKGSDVYWGSALREMNTDWRRRARRRMVLTDIGTILAVAGILLAGGYLAAVALFSF